MRSDFSFKSKARKPAGLPLSSCTSCAVSGRVLKHLNIFAQPSDVEEVVGTNSTLPLIQYTDFTAGMLLENLENHWNGYQPAVC